jgi:adhesin transport system outer membrane protein
MLSAYTKHLKRSLAACALLLASAPEVAALGFHEAVETTLVTSPVVKERLHAYRQSIQDYESAFGKYYPVVDLGAYWGWRKRDWDEPSVYTDNNKHVERYYIELRQNLFAGFSTMNETSLERARIASAAWYFMEMANDHALETATKYMEVLKQKKLLDIEQSSLKMHEKLFEDMAEREKAGAARKSDMDEIRSKLALAYSNVRTQENNLQDALIEFHRRYGEYVPADEFTMPALKLHMPQSILEATKVAIRHNPSLLVMNYEVKAHQKAYNVNKSKYYPQVDLTVRHSYNKNGDIFDGKYQETLALLSLKYNLFNGTRDSAAIQKSRSAIQEQNSRREKLKRETIEGVQLSWTAYENLNVIIPFLERHMELARQRFESYQQDFRLGHRTLLDLLIVHDDYIESQKKLARHEIDEIIARARILDAMGELPDAMNIDMRQYVGLSAHIKTEPVEDSKKIVRDADRDSIKSADDICTNTPAGAEHDYVGCANMIPLDSVDFVVPASITKDRVVQKTAVEEEEKVQKEPVMVLEEATETTLPYVEAPAHRKGRAVFYFDKFSSGLTGGEHDRLQKFVEGIDPQSKITVYGYTDTALSESKNMELAKKRCETAKQLLLAGGIDAANITVEPIGEADPIIPTDDGVLEPVNRRIEIEVIQGDAP